jgi:hypothetical protein
MCIIQVAFSIRTLARKDIRLGQINLSIEILAITPQGHLLISEHYRADLINGDGNYLVRSFTIDYQLPGGSMRDVALNDQ